MLNTLSIVVPFFGFGRRFTSLLSFFFFLFHLPPVICALAFYFFFFHCLNATVQFYLWKKFPNIFKTLSIFIKKFLNEKDEHRDTHTHGHSRMPKRIPNQTNGETITEIFYGFSPWTESDKHKNDDCRQWFTTIKLNLCWLWMVAGNDATQLTLLLCLVGFLSHLLQSISYISWKHGIFVRTMINATATYSLMILLVSFFCLYWLCLNHFPETKFRFKHIQRLELTHTSTLIKL